MTTPITTSTTDSQMHNNIMAAGSRDRPPMLATGRYAQWRSRFLRYIDKKTNGDALRKCILEGSYIPSTVVIQAVPATENSPAVPEHTTMKYTPLLMRAIQLIKCGKLLKGYNNVNPSTFKSRQTYFGNLENSPLMMENQLSHTTLEWSWFVTIVKQQHKLDEVSYHKFFDILKQYQKEVNELRAERIAKNANPLALVATAQPHQDPNYQTSKSHKSYAPTSRTSLPTRSNATTRHKGKEIAKPITPPSESASKEDSDPEQAQKDKEMQKNLALIAKYFKKLYKPTNNNLRTSSNTRNKNVDTTPRETVGGQVVQQSGIQCFNYKEFGHFAKECRKPKRVKDSTYHKEKMLLCKQAGNGVQLQAEQSDWLADTDEEIDEQELEADYSYMAKIQEVPNADSGTDSEPLEQVQYDTRYNVFVNEIQHSEQSKSISNTCVVKTVDSNVIPDSSDMCDNDIHNDQNAVECDDERVALANCKSTLEETSRTMGESNTIRDSCLGALQNKQTEFERYKAFNDHTVDYDKLERKLNETLGLLAQKDIDIKEGLKVKAYEISVVKEKHDELVK
ncbi:retrovirus-related pol polyprotein from transposon TNT 1-94 [Tanacetum coccineum]